MGVKVSETVTNIPKTLILMKFNKCVPYKNTDSVWFLF